MNNKAINISQVRKYGMLKTSYNKNIESIKRNLGILLDKKFKDSLKIPFKDLVTRVSNGDMQEGDIVIKSLFNQDLLIEVDKKLDKKNSINIRYRIKDNRISANYLLWFFSKPEVTEYLKIHLTGTVIRRIPIEIVLNMLIPIPPILDKKHKNNRIVLSDKKSPIREIIGKFYQDYQINFKENRLETSIILAGAICEAILYESLLDVGVSDKILSQNKTLGSLIEYAQIKELDKEYEVNLTHFEAIKQNRNKTIHIGSALKTLEAGSSVDREIFKDFDNIIKNFGI